MSDNRMVGTPAQGLFDDANTWASEPVLAFEGLLASPSFVALGRRELNGRGPGDAARLGGTSDSPVTPYAPVSEKSAKVYLAMFGAYVSHLKTLDLQVPDAKPEHIAQFVEAKERTTGVRHRYIRLLERVYEHMLRRGIVKFNAASLAAPHLVAAPKRPRKLDLPTAYVTKDSRTGLADTVLRTMLDSDDWRNVRDAAMAAIMLGAGLKVYELSAMRVSWLVGTHPDYFIEIPAVGVSRPHRVPLQALAADCVKAWLHCRKQMGFVQPLMFVNSQVEGRLDYVPMVSSATGGYKLSVGLDKSTVYRRVKAILKDAGVDVPRMGGRTLRNTYAVSELASGQSTALVEERLGLRESKSLKRYVIAAKKEARAT